MFLSDARHTYRWEIAALFTVLVLGWALRSGIIFSRDILLGINGAYYPVQVRAILQTGLPGLPDFPLLFYIQAGLGAIFSLFAPSDTAIVAAVRTTDIFLPVLLGIPVYLFVRAFARREDRRYGIAAAVLTAGLFAVGNGSLLRMAGDFQKNAVALPLYLMFVYFLFRALSNSRLRDYILTGIFFSLTCLTHIGVTSLAITTTVMTVLAGAASRRNQRRLLIVVSILAGALALVLTLVSLFDPQRVSRLAGVILDPGVLFSDSLIGSWFGQSFNPGAPLELKPVILGNILGLLGAGISVCYHKRLYPSERAILWGASLSTLLFASPLMGREWSQRLALMAFAPGLIPLAFLAVRVRRGLVTAAVFTAFIIITTIWSIPQSTVSTLTMPAYRELQSFRSALPKGKTVIVARHGLEWWAAWTLNTRIANRFDVLTDNWDTYDTILLLQETGSSAFTGGMRGPAGPMGGPSPIPLSIGINDPALQDADADFPIGPDGRFFPGGSGGPGIPGPVGISLPSGMLVTLREGTYFRLSRVIKQPNHSQGRELATPFSSGFAPAENECNTNCRG